MKIDHKTWCRNCFTARAEVTYCSEQCRKEDWKRHQLCDCVQEDDSEEGA